MNYCPNCGYRLTRDYKFCPECGNRTFTNKETKVIRCARCEGKGVIEISTNDFSIFSQAISRKKVTCPTCNGKGVVEI